MRLFLACALAILAPTAVALDFRSVESAAILYDAPSAKARPLYVIAAGTPVEVVVQLPQWAKVRDAEGDLAWIETSRLSPRRMVIVKAPRCEARQAPQLDAPRLFTAEAGVVLEMLEAAAAGWLKVRHRDGETGYVKASDVWGH